MADTKVQLTVEAFIRTNCLQNKFGQPFRKGKMAMTTGGEFEFDAISENRDIAVVISTSAYKTARGKNGSGKVGKIRADLYFLMLADVKRRIAVFTEEDMFRYWQMEQTDRKRVPANIEFIKVTLPDDLRAKLNGAGQKASREV